MRKIRQLDRRQIFFHREFAEGFADPHARRLAFRRENLVSAQVVALEKSLIPQPVVIKSERGALTLRTLPIVLDTSTE